MIAEGETLDSRSTAVDLLRRAATAVHGEAVSTVNDILGHAAVLAMYDRAIAIAAAAAAAECR